MRTKKTAFLLITLLLTIGCFSSQAHAAHHQDMMQDVLWNSLERPSVPSDMYRSSDMFKTQQTIMPTKSDMFSQQKNKRFYTSEEMVGVHKTKEHSKKLFKSWADQ